MEKFLNIEKKNDLYRDSIDGINYWVYARFDIWQNVILSSIFSLGKVHNAPTTSLGWKITTLAGLIKKTVFAINKKVEQADICIINHPRRVLKDGYYECIYTDRLAEYYENNIVLEYPCMMTHMEPVKTKNIFYMDYVLLKKIFYIRFCKYVLKKEYARLCTEIRRKIETPVKEMEQAFQIQINIEQVCLIIIEKILYYKASVKSTERIIDKINPKIVVEVVSYEIDCMIINEICKRKRISVIELQHGILNNHIAYSYLTDVPVLQLPDKIFLFSDFWKTMVHCPISSENLVATGFPYFECQRENARKISLFDDGKINIIFISQGTIGEKLSKLAIQLSQILGEKYRILFKLHPGEVAIWKEAYPWLKNGEIVVIEDKKYSLYDYLLTCQIQVGVYSTALYEGLGFELDTYIYEIELSSYMREVCNEGYAQYVRNAQELYECINNYSKNKNLTREFWKNDALKNMISCIDV